MAKYGIGELVRFKASELLVSAGRCSMKIGTDGLVGRITGSVETTGKETEYYVEVKLSDGTFVGVSEVKLKLMVLEGQIQSLKEHFDEFIKHIIPSFNPDPDSWIRSFLDDSDPCVKKSADAATEFADVLKRLERADCNAFADGGDKKMSKSRCIKLLESYRAERDKVKKGCKFELCLRDSVVNEALERAIELLKE